MTKTRAFITTFSAKNFGILRASHHSNRIWASVGEYTALSGQFDHLPEIAPLLNGHIDWTTIGQACGIEAELTAELKKQLRPGLDAITRWLGAPPAAEERRPPKSTVSSGKMAPAKKAASASSTRKPQYAATDGTFVRSTSTAPSTKTDKPFPRSII